MSKSKFIKFVEKIPESQINPSTEELSKFASHQEITNDLGLKLFHSKIHARSAAFTHVLTEGDNENQAIIDRVFSQVNPDDYIAMNLQIGQSEDIKITATMAVKKSNANISLMLNRNFFLRDGTGTPDVATLYVPDYEERRVIVDPKERITYVLGIDYYGEAKMSLLRMGMQIMKADRNGLGLHAGSKVIKIKNGDRVKENGMIIFGLSGTGKTTITCHDHGLTGDEGVEILQDDINFITSDGRSFGTEKGFYVKCDAFPEHTFLTEATLKPGNILENVYVDSENKVDWKNYSIARNTRAIISRESMEGTTENIDLPKLDFILYNTRRPELPPIGRLRTSAQSAAYYGLGESIITSAEDPNRVGEPKRVVGFDPFILDTQGENINRMMEITSSLPDLQSFVLNTGYVGEESNDVGVQDTSDFLEKAIRGEIEWIYDEVLGYEIPADLADKFSPIKYFGDEKFVQVMDELRSERKKYLSQFEIKDEIVKAI